MTDFNQEAPGWDTKDYRFERASAVAQAIRAAVPIAPGMSALEYGCGTGLLSFALQPFPGPITLADSAPGMLDVLAGKIAASSSTNMRPLLLDLTAGPPPDLRFGLIVTLMTLHHIPDTRAVLSAFCALLEQPGWLCVADLDSEDGAFHGPEDLTVHRGFDRAALGALAREAGFQDVSFQTVYHTPHPTPTGIRRFPVFLMVARR